MKILSIALLSLMLACSPFVAMSSVAATGEEGLATIVPNSDGVLIVDLNDQPQGASALDLSLFGVISLGIIGLFWIRRHTSQL